MFSVGDRVRITSDWWEVDDFTGKIAPYPDDESFEEDEGIIEGCCRIIPGERLIKEDEGRDFRAYWVKFDVPQRSIDEEEFCREAEIMEMDLELVN